MTELTPAARRMLEAAREHGCMMTHCSTAALNAMAEAAQPQWNDMCTAPRDGTTCLLASGGWITVGFWHLSRRNWCCDGPGYISYSDDEQPTRWMPLPKPLAPGEPT